MDPVSSAVSPNELYELLALVGGLGVSGFAGYLVVRRARAARRRQIEEAGEARPQKLDRRARRGAIEPEKDDDEAESALGDGAQGREGREGREEREEREEGEDAPRLEPPTLAPKAVPQRPEPRMARQDPLRDAPPGQPRDKPTPGTPGRAAAAHAPSPAPGPPRGEPAPAPRSAPERTAQVIPFPTPPPVEPTPIPALAPEAPSAPARKQRDVAAVATGLSRTRSGWVSKIGELFAGRKELDPSTVEEIEKILLTADIGVRTSQKLLEEIRSSLSRRELKDPEAAWDFLRKRSAQILTLEAAAIDWSAASPFVLLVIGVNGSGKTTTIGKLAAKLAADGKKVLLAAGDTFRAAAVEQLEIWAKRTGAAISRGKEGADPSSVIFDGVRRAVAEKFDVVIADTAGRLHTKTDLMQELQKIRRVVGKASPGAPHETWLVIDSTSGQNAIAQAQIFTKDVAVSGIVLTKLDGTAKGGVILGIADQLQIPVRYVGIGERVADLREFDADEFVEALYAPVSGNVSGSQSAPSDGR